MTSKVSILWREELAAVMRGRFAWVGAATILLAVGVLAAAGTQDTWLDAYGIIAYGLAPLAFIPIAACVIASPRVHRFVECVFTAPVERSHWLIAKLLVLFTIGAAYYVALIPMMAVYVAHVGVPFLLGEFLIWCAGLIAVSIAIGALIGVSFIGRSLAAPAGAGMGVLLLYAGLIPLQELMVARGNGSTRIGHLTLISPAVLLKNALGFTLASAFIPADTAATWVCLAAIFLGALVLTIWIFLRAQGVETWEATRAQKGIISLALFGMIVLPAAFADTNYDKPAPPSTNAPPIRGLFSRAGANLALTRPGGPVPTRCCGTILNRDSEDLGTDERSSRDLLVLLPVESSERIADLTIQVAGENGLMVSASPWRMETHAWPNETGPPASDGHRVVNGLVARVPVTLEPTRPWDIGGDRYPLTVRATYHLDGDPRMRSFSARAAVDAQIGSAIYQMSAAALSLPLVCIGAAVRRWRRTR
jgi:hypothetical protein